MFNETHVFTINSEPVNLAFIKSKNVQAFPCGRRRSTSYAKDDSRIPFDPEARLNTEANNRKHSSVNGFTQTYIERWDDTAVLSLAGYLFTIALNDNSQEVVKSYKDFNTFCSQITDRVGETTSIFANILIDNTQLFAGTYINEGLAYYTDVLDSWANESIKDTSALDLYISDNSIKYEDELDNYYFSGLAFSAKPIATLYKLYNEATEGEEFNTRDEYTLKNKQKVVSLRIFDKVGDSWKIHEPARLPSIEHGRTENSVVMNDLLVNKLEVQYNEDLEKDKTIDSTKISDTGVYTKYLYTQELKADGINVGDNIRADGTISAAELNVDNTITSKTVIAEDALYQKVNGVTKQVPVLELKQDGDFWQLHISRIGDKPN